MSRGIARQFIDALGRLERERELEPLVGLFADDARVGDVLYAGVSILEHHDGRIARFRAYLDPAALGRQLHAPAADGEG